LRLVAQTKLGFYPAADEAVLALCRHLSPHPERGAEVAIIDPCAGEGRAIHRIARHLNVAADRVYCVELDAGRAAKVRELMPEARLLGPASFMGTQITAGSFGLAYVNPPFDDELGGGRRQEHTFAEKATRLLRPGGILALVMPMTAIATNTQFQAFLDAYYDDAALFDFPPAFRPFREVVYLGKRRKEGLNTRGLGYLQTLGLRGREGTGRVVGTEDVRWVVPWSHAAAEVRQGRADRGRAVRDSWPRRR
jgi:predicted RNA methylase